MDETFTSPGDGTERVVDSSFPWPWISLETWYSSCFDNNNNNNPSSVVDANGAARNRPVVLHLLDVRTESDYQKHRIASSSSSSSRSISINVVHIPLEELKSRSHELPPRLRSFAVLMDHNLQSMTKFQDCLFPKESSCLVIKRNGKIVAQQKPWNVIGILSANDPGTWEKALALGLLQQGMAQNDGLCGGPRLWGPDGMVEHILLPLILEKHQNYAKIEIWDLGSGSGRDCCFLAEQLKCRGIITAKIFAVDQRYGREEQRRQCQEFWRRRKVLDCMECLAMDLNKKNSLPWELEGSSPSKESLLLVIYAVRFWNRSLILRLLEAVANASVVDLHNKKISSSATRTVLFAISHFGKPSLDAQWNFEHPKEKQVLERNELANLFGSSKEEGKVLWYIHNDNVVFDSDHGRTLIQFVAESIAYV